MFFSAALKFMMFEVMADKMAVQIECLYTKSAELRNVWIKFSLWSTEPKFFKISAVKAGRPVGSFPR